MGSGIADCGMNVWEAGRGGGAFAERDTHPPRALL